MFRNYIITAIRNLTRNKRYSFIIILCLTVGLTACLLVATVVINDLSYDRQWTKSKEIYRILAVSKSDKGNLVYTQSYAGLGPSLSRQFPEVENYCRMEVVSPNFRIGKSINGVKFKCLLADSTLWDFLDLKIISGNPKHFVNGYMNMVLTESIAKEYFPHIDPVGKIIEDITPIGKTRKLLITGVIKDIPYNTCLYANALIINKKSGEDALSGNGATFLSQQFLLLKPETNVHHFTPKINHWYTQFIKGSSLDDYTFRLEPIAQIHLYPTIGPGNDIDTSGSIHNVYIFTGVAVLLLLIACINFINLSAARMMKRVKESGIRKVLGADKKQLIKQFMAESLLYFFISFGLCMIFYSIFLDGVGKFIGHGIALSLINHIRLLVVCGGVILFVSILTGLYPAWLLSRPKAITVVRGNLFHNSDTAFLRKLLIVGQFVLAIALIIIMIVTNDQLYFLNHKNLGYNKDNLLRIGFNYWGNNGRIFKQQILELSNVESASITSWAPGVPGGGNGSLSVTDPFDSSKKVEVSFIFGDIDLVRTLGLRLEKGRLFSSHFAADTLNLNAPSQSSGKNNENKLIPSEIITAYTVEKLQIEHLDSYSKILKGIPVGVVRDFNSESLFKTMEPTVIMGDSNPLYGFMLIRVKPGASRDVIQGVDKLWQQFYPDHLLKYDWVSDILAKQYSSEKKLSQLFTLFSSLSIFLACLGLFGLIAFTAERRTKEIGIRKVLGASVNGIVALLSKEFLVLVLIGFVIASPIAWWIMNKWLQNFAYRIHISWWIFLLAGLVVVLLALITVSFQAIKAAVANPVESLRTE